MHGQVYIAGPIFNPHQVSVMAAIQNFLEYQGYNVFNPHEASQPIWNGRRPKDCTKEERQAVLAQNYQNLDAAEILICWLNGRFPDGRPDTGVVWEMGYFFRTQMEDEVERVSIGYLHPHDPLPKDLNLMLAGTLDLLCTDMNSLRRATDLIRTGLYWQAKEFYSPEMVDLHEHEVTGGEKHPTNRPEEATADASTGLPPNVQPNLRTIKSDEEMGLTERPKHTRHLHTSDPH